MDSRSFQPCVTANLQSHGHLARAREWLKYAFKLRPAIIFGQEYPATRQLSRLASEFGYDVHLPAKPTNGLRAVGSWLLVRGDIPSRALFSLHTPYVAFFGSDRRSAPVLSQ